MSLGGDDRGDGGAGGNASLWGCSVGDVRGTEAETQCRGRGTERESREGSRMFWRGDGGAVLFTFFVVDIRNKETHRHA